MLFDIFKNTFLSLDGALKEDQRNGYSTETSVKMKNQNDNAIHSLFNLANEMYLYYLSLN